MLKFFHLDDKKNLYLLAAQNLVKQIIRLAKLKYKTENIKQKSVIFLSGGSSIDLYNYLYEEILNCKEINKYISEINFAIVDERYFENRENKSKYKKVSNINSKSLDKNKSNIEINSKKIFYFTDIKRFINLSKKRLNIDVNFISAYNFDQSDQFDKLKATFTKIENHKFNTNNFQYMDHYIQKYIIKVNEFLHNDNFIKVAVLGIGQDYHIAGIKPMTDKNKFDQLFNSDQYFCTYKAQDFPIRGTLTLKALKRMDFAIVLLASKKKQEVFEKISNLHKKTFKQVRLKMHLFPLNILFFLSSCSIFSRMSTKNSAHS